MPKPLRYITYVLMVAVGLVAMYAILNAGNPSSLLRPFVRDPAHDVYVAVISSAVVFILGFLIFYSRDQEGFRQLIALNADRIRSQRQQGRRDEEIADSILAAMGSTSGYRRNLARKKLILYLSEFR